MNEFIKKLIERLEEESDSANDRITEQETEKDMAYYDGFEDGCDKAIEIVNQLAEEYNECYKDCGQCEAYNKEKHYCPKWCDVIKNTVKEMVENEPSVILMQLIEAQKSCGEDSDCSECIFGQIEDRCILNELQNERKAYNEAEEYNNDVCEWKSDFNYFSGIYKRETSCGYTFYDLNHAEPFKVCPYCGKKIKVVGWLKAEREE